MWLPRLEQILKEIEKRGYYPEINKDPDGTYRCILCKFDFAGYFFEIFDSEVIGEKSWEDAAGKTLLWLLKNS